MICVSLSEKDFEKCLEWSKEFELSEIRIDLLGFDKNQLEKIFSSGAKLIATCRPDNNVNDVVRAELLKTAILAGASYVDIEFESSYAFKQDIISLAFDKECEVIISYHNYKSTPSRDQLKIIVEQCFGMGAHIAKIACMVKKPEDNAKILSLYEPGKRIVSIGMGELGRISRIAAPFLGAEFTFASLNDELATAPGQINNEDMKKIMKLLNK